MSGWLNWLRTPQPASNGNALAFPYAGNPIGTESANQQFVSNQAGQFDPVVGQWPTGRPMTQSEYLGIRDASLNLFNQASMAAGGPAAMEAGPVRAASTRGPRGAPFPPAPENPLTPPGIRVYHGSPYAFDRFDIGKIGTGEGAQVYGHGLYFAEAEPVSESYLGPEAKWRYGGTSAQTMYDRLHNPALERGLDNEGWSKLNAQRGFWERVVLGRAPRQLIQDAMDNPEEYGPHELAYIQSLDPNKFKRSGGSMYQAALQHDPEDFLHWDKPVTEQSPQVLEALEKTGLMKDAKWYLEGNKRTYPNPTGGDLHTAFELGGHQPWQIAEKLRDAGIPGIRYLDAGSRAAGQGTHNFVKFDDNNIDLIRRYGIAGLMAGGGAAAAAGQDQGQ